MSQATELRRHNLQTRILLKRVKKSIKTLTDRQAAQLLMTYRQYRDQLLYQGKDLVGLRETVSQMVRALVSQTLTPSRASQTLRRISRRLPSLAKAELLYVVHTLIIWLQTHVVNAAQARGPENDLVNLFATSP